MDHASRVELLARIRRGDAIAVHEFYRQTEPFLRGVARRLLDPALRRHVDSVDVTQSVFRRVLAPSSMTARFEDESRFLAWLATIVRNRIRTLSRRVKGPGGGAYEARDEIALPASPVRDPGRWAADAEEIEAFRASLERLRADEREVIALHDLDGMTFQQVADLVGVRSPEAWRKLHARALAKVRHDLGAMPPDAPA